MSYCFSPGDLNLNGLESSEFKLFNRSLMYAHVLSFSSIRDVTFDCLMIDDMGPRRIRKIRLDRMK